MKKTCDYCGEELTYERCEWAKYAFSDCEELIDIYKCSCGKEYAQRQGNFEMEELIQ